jgi:hypothetical protein
MGRRAVEVVLEDGKVHCFFCQDLVAFKQALGSGYISPYLAHLGFPPKSS